MWLPLWVLPKFTVPVLPLELPVSLAQAVVHAMPNWSFTARLQLTLLRELYLLYDLLLTKQLQHKTELRTGAAERLRSQWRLPTVP